MTVALSPAGYTLAIGAAFAALLVVVIIRLVARDRSIRGVRMGVFYERERDEDYEERAERLARKDEHA